MQQLLKALRGAAGAEIVPAELLSRLLVAVDDPESAPNLRLGRGSHTCAYLTARKEGRLSNSPGRAMSDRAKAPDARFVAARAVLLTARSIDSRRFPQVAVRVCSQELDEKYGSAS